MIIAILVVFLTAVTNGCAQDGAKSASIPVYEEGQAADIEKNIPDVRLKDIKFVSLPLRDVVAKLNALTKEQAPDSNVIIKCDPGIGSGKIPVTLVLKVASLKSALKVTAVQSGLSIRIEKKQQIEIVFVEGKPSGGSEKEDGATRQAPK